jgi:hypothetical protein
VLAPVCAKIGMIASTNINTIPQRNRTMLGSTLSAVISSPFVSREVSGMESVVIRVSGVKL